MTKRTRLQELTLKHNFMFGAVMMEPENCRKLLEMTLETSIQRVEVSKEKSIVYHPEYKGVRLDVYAQDDRNVRYNVEMQVLRKPALGKRGRYYQSQMDMELLLAGEDYGELPNTCVIFICDFDPFGQKKYRYTFQIRCAESESTELEDGRCLIFLNTQGQNNQEVSKELIAFLKFIRSDLAESHDDFHDSYVQQLQDSIAKIKRSRDMEERFMILEEMLQEERAKGKIEGEALGKAKLILTVLNQLAPVSDDIRNKILSQQDLALLDEWFMLAIHAESLEGFVNNIS